MDINSADTCDPSVQVPYTGVIRRDQEFSGITGGWSAVL
jgi:hypothetical protein